jgi:hypothetical protein
MLSSNLLEKVQKVQPKNLTKKINKIKIKNLTVGKLLQQK